MLCTSCQSRPVIRRRINSLTLLSANFQTLCTTPYKIVVEQLVELVHLVHLGQKPNIVRVSLPKVLDRVHLLFPLNKY